MQREARITARVAAMAERLGRLLFTPVLVQEPVDVPDGQGGQRRTWATHTSTTGLLRSSGASSRAEAGVVAPRGDIVLVIPYLATLTTDMRFVVDNRTLEIVGKPVDIGTLHAFHRIVCEED